MHTVHQLPHTTYHIPHTSNRTTLITGATDGLGLELARECVARGERVVLVGRRPLGTLADPVFTPATYCQADLEAPDAPQIVATWLTEHGISTLDVLVHNAARGWYGAPETHPPNDVAALLTVNVTTPLALTHALLPWLERARGTVVLVSSVAATLPVPHYAVYAASKAALEGMGRALRAELRPNVRVQIIRPGTIHTQLHRKSGVPAALLPRRAPPARRVAAQLLAAIRRGGRTRTLGVGNRALVWFGQRTRLADRFVRWQTRRARKTPRVAPLPAVIPPPPDTQAVNQPALTQRTRRSITGWLQPGRIPAARHTPARTSTDGTPQHAVITGGADGIGRALALQLAAQGWQITIVDRDDALAQRTLDVLATPGTAIIADLADPAAVERVVASLEAHDLLIHSAGISAVGRFAAVPLAQQRAVLAVNLHAPIQLTTGVLARKLLRPNGALVCIASLSCFTGYPGAVGYAASKDGLAHYARVLRPWLAAQQVWVLTVYPGPTRTAHARRYSPDNRREARRMSPERLAARIITALAQDRNELIPGAANRAFALVGRVMPSVTEAVMKRVIVR